MRYEISPEPDPNEREALEAALARLLAAEEKPAPYRSRWREAGLRESVEDEEEEE